MPIAQTVLFESVEVDVSNNKQLFIHPIHRVVAEQFPVTLKFAVLTCCYDLKPGQYGCRHSFWTGDKKRKLVEFSHEPVRIDTEGGGMGFRTSFDNVKIEGPGRYWVRVEVPGMRAEEVLLRIEEKKKGAPRLNLKA